jgi:hypothetical protein
MATHFEPKLPTDKHEAYVLSFLGGDGGSFVGSRIDDRRISQLSPR